MGWHGYGIYDGDGTMSLHYDFIQWAGIKVYDDSISTKWMGLRGTKIPKSYKQNFIKGIPKILKKMPKKPKYFTQDSALDWQMLAALLQYNKIYHKQIYKNACDATEYLMGEHAANFDYPYKRRAALKAFLKKIK